MTQAALSQILKAKWTQFNCYRSIAMDALKVAAFLVLPVLFNMMFWNVFVAPIQQEKISLQQTRDLIALKPRLESLLTESKVQMDDWMTTGWKIKEPMHAIEQLQQLARKHDIKIRETRLINSAKDLSMTPAKRGTYEALEVPVSLEVAGNFNKLGRWLNELENQPLVRIESAKLKPSTSISTETQMNLEIKVLVPKQ